MVHTNGAAAFLAAWKALCRDTATPHFRTAFQQLSPKILPRIMILERTAEGKYIIRFMGTAYAALYGEDLTGRDFLGVVPRAMTAAADRNMSTMMAHPCGMRYFAEYVTSGGRKLLMEHVSVPVDNEPGLPLRLLNYAGEVSALGYTEPRGEIQKVTQRTWIDVGAGIPAKPPVNKR